MRELNMESSKRVRVAFNATETRAGREDQGKEAETLLKETRTDTSHGQWIKRTRLNQKRDSTVDTKESLNIVFLCLFETQQAGSRHHVSGVVDLDIFLEMAGTRITS